MLQACFILSLKITAVHICFKPGMIAGWIRVYYANAFDEAFGRLASKYIQKPLWDCLACMSGFWYIIFEKTFDIDQVLIVCTINYFIQKIIEYAH